MTGPDLTIIKPNYMLTINQYHLVVANASSHLFKIYTEQNLAVKMGRSACLIFHANFIIFGHFLVADPPNQLSWITNHWSPISPQVPNYNPAWFLNQRETNDHKTECPRSFSMDWTTEPLTPGLQILRSNYWANRADKDRQQK